MKQDNPSFRLTCPNQAFFAIVFACMAADEHVSLQEVEILVKMLSKRRQFEGETGVDLFKYLYKVHLEAGGSKALIQKADPFVDPQEREDLFVAALEAMQADKVFHAAEMALMETLQASLSIPLQVATHHMQAYKLVE